MTASTASLAVGAWKDANAVPVWKAASVLQIASFSKAVATAQLDEEDDATEIAYLPAGMTVYQVIVTATDMDSGTAALVYDIELAGTKIVTGATVGQSAGTALTTLTTPLTTTDYSLLSMVVTTAAATAVAGTITVRVIYTTP